MCIACECAGDECNKRDGRYVDQPRNKLGILDMAHTPFRWNSVGFLQSVRVYALHFACGYELGHTRRASEGARKRVLCRNVNNANAANVSQCDTPARLSHFVFPDCEFSPSCAADLVFYRCMRMNPLAPPAGGAFFMRAVCCVQPVLRPPR